MTRAWHTAKELAGLPGLPQSESAVIRRAKREGWMSRKSQGTKATEYALDSLPEETRTALLDRMIETLPAVVCPLPPALVADNLPAAATLANWQRMTMDARCVILNHINELAKICSQNKAIKQVVARAKTETLPEHIQALVPVANARSGGSLGQQTLSERTLKRWIADRKQGITALAPKEAEPKPLPAWVPYFLKAYQVAQNLTIPEAMEQMAMIMPEGLPMPSEQQVRRFHAKRSKLDRERGRKTGNDWRAIKGYRHRDRSDFVPLEEVQCDGHSFKGRVAHPVHGRPFHPEVCAVIDSATRMAIGWSAGLAESAETVADALRHAIKHWGVPTIFYTDPGSGNLAHVNAHPLWGRYARLDITFKTGIAGNSQARGLIERFNRSCWIRAAKQLPTFTGSSMDGSTLYRTTRLVDKDIKKQGASQLLPSWPQFLDFCPQAIDAYNNRPHSALPKITDDSGRRRHMTPVEMMQSFLNRGWQPDLLTAAELDDMFRPRKQVTTRRGKVRLFTNTYYNSELEHHAGEQVYVEYEPQDGSFVYVRDMEERLICKAGFEANSVRSFPLSVSEQGSNKRAAGRVKRLESQLEEIEMERVGVIEVTAEQQEARAELIAEMTAEQAESTRHETPGVDIVRYRLACAYERRIKNGEELPPGGQTWLRTYQANDEYAIFREVERDLGAKP